MPMYFYSIDNLIATSFTPGDPNLPELQNGAQYLIVQQYHEDNGPNRHFSYTVKNRLSQNTVIERNSWKINKISTFSAFNPNQIFFEFEDPNGIANSDLNVKILRGNKGRFYYIAFPGVSSEPLNQGLELFKRLSNFKNWYEFLISPSNEGYSIDALDRFTNLERDNASLRTEIAALQDKLARIQEVLI